MAEGLGSAVLTLSVDDRQFQAGLQRAEQVAGQKGQSIARKLGKPPALPPLPADYFKQLESGAGAASNKVQSLTGELLRVAAGFVTFGAIAGFFRGSVQAAVELETITRKLSNTLGEGGAARALSFTKGLADQLGLSFKTLANSFGSFTAAATSAGVPLEQQRELFAAVATSAQRLGLSNDELKGSLLALQQVASKGTVQMEELRGQLGERLPVALGATAKGLGLTQRELIKLVETGRLASGEFFAGLTRGLNELNGTSAGAPTTAQNFQKLSNSWDALQTSFGTNLLPAVTESVKALNAVTDGLGRKQIADRLGFGTGAAGALGFLSDGAIQAAEAYKRLQRQFDLTDQQATALFFDARQNAGVLPFASLNERDANRVIVEFERVAEAWRKRFPVQDPIFDEAIVDTSLNTIGKVQERIKSLQQERIGLDVDSSRFREVGREIDDLQKRLNQLSAPALQIGSLQGFAQQAQEARALAETLAPNTQAFSAAIQRYELANEGLRSASNAIERSFTLGADRVLQASRGATEVLRGSFDLLRSDLRGQLLKQARSEINFDLFSAARIGSDPSRIFAAAAASRQLEQNLSNVGKTFQSSSSDLNGQMVSLSQIMSQLASKDWSVNVQVGASGATAAYGDVLNGAVQ